MHYYNGKVVRNFCPFTKKWQLIDYVVKNCGFKVSKARKMSIAQLKKMYYLKPLGKKVTYSDYLEDLGDRVVDNMINKARGK